VDSTYGCVDDCDDDLLMTVLLNVMIVLISFYDCSDVGPGSNNDTNPATRHEDTQLQNQQTKANNSSQNITNNTNQTKQIQGKTNSQQQAKQTTATNKNKQQQPSKTNNSNQVKQTTAIK
jgi:preprotein translocase subunit SecF